VLARRIGVLARGQPAAGPGGARLCVDLEPVELGQVEGQAAVDDAEGGRAVAAVSHRELGPRVARERDDPGNLRSVGGPDDRRRAAVEAAGKDGARLVVVGILGRDHAAVEHAAQLVDGEQLLDRGHRRGSIAAAGAPNNAARPRRDVRLSVLPDHGSVRSVTDPKFLLRFYGVITPVVLRWPHEPEH
jgi:hypothetical protein